MSNIEIKKTLRIVLFGVSVLSSGLLLLGCSVVAQTYAGPHLSRDEIAIVKNNLSLSKPNIMFYTCDGADISSSADQIELLPGTHKLVFIAIAIVGYGFHEIGRYETDISVEAGGNYLATGRIMSPAQVDPRKGNVVRPAVLVVDVVATK